MKIVMLEPLGVSHTIIRQLAMKFEELGHEFIMFDNRTEDRCELALRAKNAEVLILSNLPFPPEIIYKCPQLKMISVAFTGVDHIGIEACRERGITVCNASGYSNHSVAELAYGMMISLLRSILQCDVATRNGKTKEGLVGNDLYGKTLGIIGTGAIGIRVAEIGRAFGCNLLAYSRTQKDEVKALGIKYVDLDTLMSQSDIVTLHIPLSESTKGLIGKKELGLMKSSAILINTARGPIIDNTALAQALKEGQIAGAGIDVYEMEPPLPSHHPLLDAPNVLLTPHVAFATKEALIRRAEIAFDNVKAWLQGKKQNLIV